MIWLNKVVMTSFNHEWSRKNEIRHFRITESASQFEIRHFPFNTLHEASFLVSIDHLAGPVSEISRTNGKAVAFQHSRNAHGSFTSITKSIKCNPVLINKWKAAQPPQRLLMLGNNEREKSFLNGICLSPEPAVPVFSAIWILRHVYNEPLIGQLRGRIIICSVVSLNQVLWYMVSPMLANHHGSSLPSFDVLRYQKNSLREKIWKNIQYNFIACPSRFIVNLAHMRIR